MRRVAILGLPAVIGGLLVATPAMAQEGATGGGNILSRMAA